MLVYLPAGGDQMYAGFTYEEIELEKIQLDDRNPRIVTQTKLKSQAEILQYLFDHEDLEAFIKKIAVEGKNVGAERPYVVSAGKKYVVVEGNTRIAAYKVLTGQIAAPAAFTSKIPQISVSLRDSLLKVDCTVSPTRDALLPIMAHSHFGAGDKSKWGYLGSRKAVFDEWTGGKSSAQLAKAFDQKPGQINDLILEYQLYLAALALPWDAHEKAILLNPAVEFNPPVRFLQAKGHKAEVGISYDRAALKVDFKDAEAKAKFKHLVKKLVINPEPGLGATAQYSEVFADYVVSAPAPGSSGASSGGASSGGATSSGTTGGAASGTGSAGGSGGSSGTGAKNKNALFVYDSTITSGLLAQLMKEAKAISVKAYPSASTFLLRNIVETILKHIIDDQKANTSGKVLDLEGALNLCASAAVKMPNDDKKLLAEFKKTHLAYLNLGAHGNLIPNPDRTFSARDCIDQFIKKYA